MRNDERDGDVSNHRATPNSRIQDRHRIRRRISSSSRDDLAETPTREMDSRNTDSPEDAPSGTVQKPEIRWLALRLLDLAGGDARRAGPLDPKTVLSQTARASTGPERQRIRELARGIYLMAHDLHRAALVAFEEIIGDHARGELDTFAELALEAHAFTLLRLDCRRDARTEFERLVREKLRKGRDSDQPVRIATLVGLLRVLDTAA